MIPLIDEIAIGVVAAVAVIILALWNDARRARHSSEDKNHQGV